MAEELQRELGLQSDLVRGSGGVFEIEYDGKLLFSKKKLGRFPEDGEVVNMLKGPR